MRYLVEFERNWADEFDVHGLAIMTPEQYELILKYSVDVNYNFGSNEGWEDEDLSDSFKILTCDEDAICGIETVISFTGYGSYKTWGNFPDIMDSAFSKIWDEYYDTRYVDDAIEVYYTGVLVYTAKEYTGAADFIHADITKRFPEFNY